MIIYGGYRDLKGSTNEMWAFHFGNFKTNIFFLGFSLKKTFILCVLVDNFEIEKYYYFFFFHANATLNTLFNVSQSMFVLFKK